MCVNKLDAEGVHGQAKVGEMVRIVCIVVNRAKISICFLRNAVTFNVIDPEAQHRESRFGLRKTEHRAARGIIDGDKQRTAWSAVFEPIMLASVELNERSDGVPPFPPFSMATSFSVKRPELFC